MRMNATVDNDLVLGEVGSATKCILFNVNEFKRNLAPANAKIEYVILIEME